MLRSLALLIVCTLSVLWMSPSAQATIIDYNCASDGDGAIVMSNLEYDYELGELDCAGQQYRGPAHINGDFGTDTPLDPTVKFINTIENDTDFAWTGYVIDLTMDKTFTLQSVAAPSGWLATVTQPTMVNGKYVGVIEYSGGAPITVGQDGTFGYKASFAGSVAFSQAMTPLPEPGSLLLLAGGSVFMFLRRRRSARE